MTSDSNTQNAGQPAALFSAAGRRVLITGAASGIGLAAARMFASAGARLLGVDLPAADPAAALTGLDQNRVKSCALDIAGPDAPEAIMAQVQSQLGGLDVLINNAGAGFAATPADTSDRDWDRIQDVNLRAPFRLCRSAIPLLRQSGSGRIVNIASVMAERADYGLAAYCASKAGLAGLTRSLALELGKDGITCNYILPGAILTGMTQATLTVPNIAEVWQRKSPLKRLGTPEDVAAAIYFLSSLEAAFITGTGLEVSGALALRT